MVVTKGEEEALKKVKGVKYQYMVTDETKHWTTHLKLI